MHVGQRSHGLCYPWSGHWCPFRIVPYTFNFSNWSALCKMKKALPSQRWKARPALVMSLNGLKWNLNLSICNIGEPRNFHICQISSLLLEFLKVICAISLSYHASCIPMTTSRYFCEKLWNLRHVGDIWLLGVWCDWKEIRQHILRCNEASEPGECIFREMKECLPWG